MYLITWQRLEAGSRKGANYVSNYYHFLSPTTMLLKCYVKNIDNMINNHLFYDRHLTKMAIFNKSSPFFICSISFLLFTKKSINLSASLPFSSLLLPSNKSSASLFMMMTSFDGKLRLLSAFNFPDWIYEASTEPLAAFVLGAKMKRQKNLNYWTLVTSQLCIASSLVIL